MFGGKEREKRNVHHAQRKQSKKKKFDAHFHSVFFIGKKKVHPICGAIQKTRRKKNTRSQNVDNWSVLCLFVDD